MLHRLIVILSILGAMLFSPTSFAGARPDAKIAVEAFSGRVLSTYRADEYRYPASLTKIMTLYILFDEVKAGRISLDTQFKVSAKAAAVEPSKLGLRQGQTISAKDAMYSLITKSANDAAITVAENISGSEAAFAKKMTAKARQLGMSKTTFKNASGLPHSQQRTTARDMATLGRALILHHLDYYQYFSTKHYTYKGTTYKNHNKLLTDYKGVDGIKTGYIRASGFNLVASARREDMRIVAVVIGGETSASRNNMMTKLLDESFAKLENSRRNWIQYAARPSNPSVMMAQNTAEIEPTQETPKIASDDDPIANILMAQQLEESSTQQEVNNQHLANISPMERPSHFTTAQPQETISVAQASASIAEAPQAGAAVAQISEPKEEVRVAQASTPAANPTSANNPEKETMALIQTNAGKYAILLPTETSLARAKETGLSTQNVIGNIINYSKVQIAVTHNQYYTPLVNNLHSHDAITACQLLEASGKSCKIKSAHS